MSIIHEALKKVQSNRSPNSPPLTADEPLRTKKADPIKGPSAAVSHQPLSAKTKTWSWDEILWAFIICGLCALTFFYLYDLSQNLNELNRVQPAKLLIKSIAQTQSSQTLNATLATPPLSATASQLLEVKPKPQPGEIMLYGITFMDGKKFALLNEGIYQTGEEVDGYQIINIADDYVEVIKDGKKKKLKTSHR